MLCQPRVLDVKDTAVNEAGKDLDVIELMGS